MFILEEIVQIVKRVLIIVDALAKLTPKISTTATDPREGRPPEFGPSHAESLPRGL